MQRKGGAAEWLRRPFRAGTEARVARLKGLRSRVGPLKPRLAKLDDARGEMDRRRALRPWRKWYTTARWRALRWQVLVRDLFTCQRCGRVAFDTSKLVADHKEPHRGVASLFWDIGNVWTLCAPCHSGAKQREEAAGL